MTHAPADPRSYRAVPAQIDLPALEQGVLDLWRSEGTFAATLEATRDAPRWTFYEGPPTANGTPGTHHAEARVFKDVFPRFKTMQGHHVERKAGWDCHGLPVEIAVEKELGLGGKPDIEAYGVAEFNARCRESVLRNVDLFEQMTDRLGYWTDMAHPYRTMDTEYVQSVWWALAQIHAKGLLTEDHRVAPYCPRCGTTLSDHELAQGYETIVDPSVYVRFPLTSGPWEGTDLLVWTTTPWTLVSNTAVAVQPEVTYVVATHGDDRVVVAEDLLEAALGEGWTVVDRIQGRAMERWTYRRPFDLVEFPVEPAAHFVVLADYVTTDDGTGLVHQSPAFGADDMAVSRAYGLPVVNPIGPDGHFAADVPMVGGAFFKVADDALVADLVERGLLFRRLDYEHSYPHCWRCHTPLMYYALPAWYIRTTAVKDRLLEENENTAWYPSTIKHGRFGDWLDNNIDWSLSRSRYWGTPLPIWRNDADPTDVVCVESLTQLSDLTGRDLADLDPHRPAIDEVTFTVDGTPGTYRRVPEVIDAWFDSGAMPFAQWGYPHAPGSAEKFERAYPAQYICEAIDQTRGWFYSLMAVGTLVFDRSSYENVVCLGHILAEDGRKMSKHLGNILPPMPLMDEHGADALRWFMACSGSAWSARRIGHTALTEIVRKVLLTYWNTVAFQTLYARAEGWSPASGEVPAVADREVLDRWVVSELHQLTLDVTAALERFDTADAGARLARFVDDVSNWYVRRSRRRFWRGDVAAFATLHETIDVLTRLMAPLVPFVTERVWQDVVRPTDPDAAASVHLAAWPVADTSLIVDGLADRVDLARRVTELGRAARAEAKVRTRQPLRRALVASTAHSRLGDELRAQVCDELNIGELASLAEAGGDVVDHTAKGNFRSLGRRFGPRTPLVAAAVEAADAAALAADLAAHGTATVTVEGEDVEVGPDDVIVSERPREGWSVVNDQGETVALDLELDDELRRAGRAREIIRAVQEARKASGFDITDRISLAWTGGEPVADAVGTHLDLIADEVLATDVHRLDGDHAFHDEELGFAFSLTRQ
ncbi:isoleucine--tRNA ligase [Aeromicrobium marinum DSM 15272]|uniref:Isoleucine--tRNA ligase n=1 Tax=Aeromicrobium marinum DSM 15272 TaxID=585531 RepID=E2S955_9ACTN|nr:isoleucine--tRNA ligase [Aeromicrobium marinum]EFQ84325.1 isoleucine--tRNA ligase [Aeromicrobium marinum DSM 15272]